MSDDFSRRFLLWNGRVLDFAQANQGTINAGPGPGTLAPAKPPPAPVNVKKGVPVTAPPPGVSVRIVKVDGFVYAGCASRIPIEIRLKKEEQVNRLLLRVYKQFTPETKAPAVERLVYQELLDHGQVLALPERADDLPAGNITFDAGGWATDLTKPYRVVIWVSATPTAFDVSARRLTDPDTHYNDVKYRGRTVHDQSGALWGKTKLDDKLLGQTKYKFNNLFKTTQKRAVNLDAVGVNLIPPTNFGVVAHGTQTPTGLGEAEMPLVAVPDDATDLGLIFVKMRGKAQINLRPLHANEPGTAVSIEALDGTVKIFTTSDRASGTEIVGRRIFAREEIPPAGLPLWVESGIAHTSVRESGIALELLGAPVPQRMILPVTIVPDAKPLTNLFRGAPYNGKLRALVKAKAFDLKDTAPTKTGFHGTSSLLLSNWAPGNFSLLSLKELAARNIAQMVGEGDSQSSTAGLKDQISIGIGSDGFGLAAAYGWATGSLPTYNVTLFTDDELAEEYRLAKQIVDADARGVTFNSSQFSAERFARESEVQAKVWGVSAFQISSHLTQHQAMKNSGGYAKRLKDEIDRRAGNQAAAAPFGVIFEFALAGLQWRRAGSSKGEGIIDKELKLDTSIVRVYAPRGELDGVLAQVKLLAPARANNLDGIPFEAIDKLADDAIARVAFKARVNKLVEMSNAMRASLRAIDRALNRAPPPVQEDFPRELTPAPSAVNLTVPGMRVGMASVKTDYIETVERTVDDYFLAVELARSKAILDGGHADDQFIFLAPEWYFRKPGAVPYTHAEMRAIIEAIKVKSLDPKYDKWIFAPGTIYFGLGYDGGFDAPDDTTIAQDLKDWFKLTRTAGPDPLPTRVEPGTITHYWVGNVGFIVQRGKLASYRFKIFNHDIDKGVAQTKMEQWAFDRIPLEDARKQSGPVFFNLVETGKTTRYAYEICREHFMQTAALAHANKYKAGGKFAKKKSRNGVDIHILVCNEVGADGSAIVARNRGYFLHCEGVGADQAKAWAIKRKLPPVTDPTVYQPRFDKEADQIRINTAVGANEDEANQLKADLKQVGLDPQVKQQKEDRLKELDEEYKELMKQGNTYKAELKEIAKAIAEKGTGDLDGAGTLGERIPLTNNVWFWPGKIYADE